MKIKLLLIALTLFCLCGCQGAQNTGPTASASPAASPTVSETAEATSGPAHLELVPFKLTLTSKAMGESQTMTFTGDAEGKVTVTDGQREDSAQFFADGRFKAEDQPVALMLSPDGVILVNDQPSKVKVDADGAVSVDGKPVFHHQGETLVDADPNSPNAIFKEENVEVVIEGDAKARRQISFMLATFLMPVMDQSSMPQEAPSAPEGHTATPIMPESSETP